jgi:hypothetical protein
MKKSEKTYGTQTQYPVKKASRDLKKITAFIALSLRHDLTNGFIKKGTIITRYNIGCVKKFTI